MEYAQLEPTRPAPITATLPDLPNTAVQPPIRLYFPLLTRSMLSIVLYFMLKCTSTLHKITHEKAVQQ